MTTQRYDGKSITILNHDGRCIHSRNCVPQRPEVFIANADGPWIVPDAAHADRVVATISACPSGALRSSDTTMERRRAHRSSTPFTCARTDRWR